MLDEIVFVVDATLYNGLGYTFVVFGVLISIRFLGYPDLTPDGSFTLSACVFARIYTQTGSQILSVSIGLLSGILCGLLTGLVNLKLKIGKLLSSILVMTLAISAAPYVLNSATISLLREPTLLNYLALLDSKLSKQLLPGRPFVVHFYSILLFAVLCALAYFVVHLFSKSKWGVEIRYLGSITKKDGIRKEINVRGHLVGLALANFFVSLGGIIEAQRRGNVNQGMGLGIVLVGVSALIVGESFLRNLKRTNFLDAKTETMAVIIGVLLYNAVVQLAFSFFDLEIDFKTVSIVCLALLLAASHLKRGRENELF